MMQSGEGDIFAKLGFWQVFYGDTLLGARLPNLSYMLGFDNLADREKKWAAFMRPRIGNVSPASRGTPSNPSSPTLLTLS